MYNVKCTLYSFQHTVYSVQCTIIVYCILLLYSVLALIFVHLQYTIVYYSTGVCCDVLFLFNKFYYLLWYSIYFFIHYINYLLFVGKNCECLHNIILLHLNFIFWRRRPAKTANAYTTYFYCTWIYVLMYSCPPVICDFVLYFSTILFLLFMQLSPF